MIIDIQLLHMVASVTEKWPLHADAIERYCRADWHVRDIYPYMLKEFIQSKVPITCRLFELDSMNQRLLLLAIKSLGKDLCPLVIDCDLEGQKQK